jgi:hypothetical protein
MIVPVSAGFITSKAGIGPREAMACSRSFSEARARTDIQCCRGVFDSVWGLTVNPRSSSDDI